MSRTRSAVVIGVVVGVLIFGFAYSGLMAWQALRSSDHGSEPSRSRSVQPPVDTGPFPKTDPKLAKFYDQKLSWKSCASTRECARLTVPLDYADPSGETVSLAVLRVPAFDRKHRVGQLVVNPGGPGGSGTQYAAAGALQFGDLAKRYDIVGFDPRGVAKSDGLQCVDTETMDAFIAADPDPDDAAERPADGDDGDLELLRERLDRRGERAFERLRLLIKAPRAEILRRGLR